ncbi:MAG: response regulator [Melioribacteraceae bacterium]|nr:response regulator [Melioribacteraceae bacterium]
MSTKSKLTILIVDDSDITRNSLKNFFEDYKLEVITCSDGLEGIQMALECKPNLIFLDLLMPNLNGLKTLQVMKVVKDIKSIPVIVISGNTNKQNVIGAIEAGAEKVLSKPLKKDLIIKSVNEILGEDVLKKSEGEKTLSDEDNFELRRRLVKFFLNSFPEKKKAILEGLSTKNKDLMNIAIHEIKGTGGLIGYPEITVLAGRIMNKLNQSHIDWNYIRYEIDELFNLIKIVEIPKEELSF